MLLATAIVVLGLAGAVVIGRHCRFRPALTLDVPVIAVYTLYAWYALPLFLLGFGVAVAGLTVLDRWLLLYGYRRRLVAVGLGTAIPLLTIVTGWAGVGTGVVEVDLVGALLPGLAAIRLREATPHDRRLEIGASFGLLALLVGGGAVLAFAAVLPPCRTCGVVPWPRTGLPVVVINRRADLVAALFGGSQPGRTALAAPPVLAGIVAVGGGLAAASRWRWGLRFPDIVTVPVLALFALRSAWLLLLAVMAFALVAIGLPPVARRSLLGDTVHRPMAVTAALVVVLITALAVPVNHGPALFFVGIVAGHGADRLVAEAPADRPVALAIGLGAMALVFALARTVIEPRPGGLGASVGPIHLVSGVVILLAAGWAIDRLERPLPAIVAVRDASPFRERLP